MTENRSIQLYWIYPKLCRIRSDGDGLPISGDGAETEDLQARATAWKAKDVEGPERCLPQILAYLTGRPKMART